MADALIDIVGPEELPLVVELYNQIFRPGRNVESFQRRYLGRHNILQLVAQVDNRPVGFFLGFELKPRVFFAWFYGVLPAYRRQGIASVVPGFRKIRFHRKRLVVVGKRLGRAIERKKHIAPGQQQFGNAAPDG